LRALLKATHYSPPPGHGTPLDLPGHYAGLVRIGKETVAITTDTVGTKVLLAEELGRWEEVGEDVVAVNVNDLAAVGARPAGFVDCILCGRPDPKVLGAVGRGIRRGLVAAKCGLLGGETAVVPDIVRGFDLGGTAIGFFPDGRRPVTGESIRAGDVLLGLPSSGFHANGLTLLRRLLRERRWPLRRRRKGAKVPLGIELLGPTRSYVSAVEAAVNGNGVTGLAHISGGGVRNLPRLSPGVRFVLDGWPEPGGLFAWVDALDAVPPRELYQTFNMGIGFVIVAREAKAGAVLGRLKRAGVRDTRVVGHIERGNGVHLPHLGLSYAGYE
jgi:phosphoribosylformylglycinamidine cyclo-ligase